MSAKTSNKLVIVSNISGKFSNTSEGISNSQEGSQTCLGGFLRVKKAVKQAKKGAKVIRVSNSQEGSQKCQVGLPTGKGTSQTCKQGLKYVRMSSKKSVSGCSWEELKMYH